MKKIKINDEKTKYFTKKIAELDNQKNNREPPQKVKTKYFGPTIQQHEVKIEKIFFVNDRLDISFQDYVKSIGCEIEIGENCVPYVTKLRGFYFLDWNGEDFVFYPNETRDIDKQIFNYLLEQRIIAKAVNIRDIYIENNIPCNPYYIEDILRPTYFRFIAVANGQPVAWGAKEEDLPRLQCNLRESCAYQELTTKECGFIIDNSSNQIVWKQCGERDIVDKFNDEKRSYEIEKFIWDSKYAQMNYYENLMKK